MQICTGCKWYNPREMCAGAVCATALFVPRWLPAPHGKGGFLPTTPSRYTSWRLDDEHSDHRALQTSLSAASDSESATTDKTETVKPGTPLCTLI